MGVLRLFLALTVLNSHYPFSGASVFPSAYVAVCCFFIISGFYMSLVINEKYAGSANGLARFYLNRALRLYPANIVLLLAFALTGAMGITQSYAPFSAAADMSATGRLLTILNQVLIFPGVVWQNVTLRPDGDANTLVFGQLYTVGLEMMFYAVAPFLVTRRPKVLAALLAVALGAHFALRLAGPPRPWQYEFFPGILAFFLLGSVSYHLLRAVRSWACPAWIGYLGLPLVVLYCMLAHRALTRGFTNEGKVWLLYALITLIVPFLFQATRRARWDRYLGELSYPVYAVHMLVGLALEDRPDNGMAILLVTLLAAAAMLIVVELPVEAVRGRIGRARLATKPGHRPPLDPVAPQS